MSLREFTGIESDFVFEPVGLEGQQALVHADRDAGGCQLIGIGAAFRVEGTDQVVQFRRQRFQEAAAFEAAAATGLAIALSVGDHRHEQLPRRCTRQGRALSAKRVGDAFLLLRDEKQQPQQLALVEGNCLQLGLGVDRVGSRHDGLRREATAGRGSAAAPAPSPTGTRWCIGRPNCLEQDALFHTGPACQHL